MVIALLNVTLLRIATGSGATCIPATATFFWRRDAKRIAARARRHGISSRRNVVHARGGYAVVLPHPSYYNRPRTVEEVCGHGRLAHPRANRSQILEPMLEGRS